MTHVRVEKQTGSESGSVVLAAILLNVATDVVDGSGLVPWSDEGVLVLGECAWCASGSAWCSW